MTDKTLNELHDELVVEHVLTDELLEFFYQIDIMNSVGMMAWLVGACREALQWIERGGKISHNSKELDREGFLHVLNENISNLLMDRILCKI